MEQYKQRQERIFNTLQQPSTHFLRKGLRSLTGCVAVTGAALFPART
jgi:hypothetical protein